MTERGEKFALALVEPPEELDVLQTRIVNKRAEKAHREIEHVADNNYHNAEYNTDHALREKKFYGKVVREYRGDLRAGKHKSVKTGVTENIRSLVYQSVNGRERLDYFADSLFGNSRSENPENDKPDRYIRAVFC